MDFRETDKLILDNTISILKDSNGLSDIQLKSLYVIVGCTLGLNDDRVYNMLGNVTMINGKHCIQHDHVNIDRCIFDDDDDTLDCDSTDDMSDTIDIY